MKHFLILISLISLAFTQLPQKTNQTLTDNTQNITIIMNQKNFQLSSQNETKFSLELKSINRIPLAEQNFTLNISDLTNSTFGDAQIQSISNFLNSNNSFTLKMGLDYFKTNGTIPFSYKDSNKTFVEEGNVRVLLELSNLNKEKFPEDFFLVVNLNHLKKKICLQDPSRKITNCLYEKGEFILSKNYLINNQTLKSSDISFRKIDSQNDEISIFLPKDSSTNTIYWEGLFNLKFESTEHTPVEYEYVNRLRNFNKTQIETDTKGGEITIRDQRLPLSASNELNISLVRVYEVNGDGKMIGDGENVTKHRIMNFSEVNFETNYGPDNFEGFNTTKMGIRGNFSYPGGKDLPTIKMGMSSFKHGGNLTFIGEDYEINKEDMRFDLELDLTNWDFCRAEKKNCPNSQNKSEYDNTEFFEMVYEISNNEIPKFNQTNLEFKHVDFSFANKYYTNKTYVKFADGFPKYSLNGTKAYLTFRFPYSENRVISYDGNFILLNLEEIEEEGSNALIIASIVIFVLILILGVFLYLRKSKRRSSIAIESSSRFSEV